jgi:putative peptidoglycan lipid II flippase
LFYAIGLWAFSAVRIVVSTFYAMQDTKTPVRMAIVSVGANIILGIVLMQWLAHGGLALATSLASMLNFGLLLWVLRRRLGGLSWQDVGRSIRKTVFSSALMGIVVWLMASWVIPSAGDRLMPLLFGLIGCILAGIVCYGLVSVVVKSAEIQAVWSIARDSLKRQSD